MKLSNILCQKNKDHHHTEDSNLIPVSSKMGRFHCKAWTIKTTTNNQPTINHHQTTKKNKPPISSLQKSSISTKKKQETWGHQRAWLPKTLGAFLHFLHAPRPLLRFARRIQAVHGTLGQASLADIVGAPWAILMGSMGLEFYGKWLVNIPVTWILWKMVGIIYYFEKMSSTSGFFCFSIVQVGISRWFDKVHVEFFF